MKIIIFVISFIMLSGCATYVEEANNQQFKPLRPSFEEFERAEPSNGSIYSTSSSGLFSSDRRAKKVGDILQSSLNFDEGREIAENLYRIYEFAKDGIMKGFTKRDSKLVYDAIPPIDEILDGWKKIK